MKMHKIISILLTVALVASVCVTPASATSYTAMIVQGNTPDVGDCKVVFENLKNVPDGNSYTISNRGWHYNNGNSFHNYSKWPTSDSEYSLACAQDLIDAKNYDVLYWSGHGGRNPIRLNVHPSSNDYGPGSSQQPTINIASTLGVNSDNWANTSVWDKDSSLKVVIFSACQVLDNTYGDCKYLVRAMKASNVRVIAGYHLTSPTNPVDTNIATAFFDNTRNGGVSGGESIRSSWQTANELNSAASRWAVLCYKDNSNQYYRIPGFPGRTYSAPSDGATVYRFWSSYTDSTGGQTMTTSLCDNVLPIEISTAAGASRSANNDGLITYRDMNEDHQGTLDEAAQRVLAQEYLDEKYQAGIEWVGTISCEEVNEEVGSVPGTESVVGKTFCYNNQCSGIRLVNNFYKVATDADGVYSTMNNWKDITSQSDANTGNTQIVEPEGVAVPYAEDTSIESMELVYVPVDATTYRLCYEVALSDLTTYFVDAVTGDVIDIYIG